MTTAPAITEREIAVAGLSIRLQQDGSGEPLLLLHHSTGNLGWIALYERLAESFAVTVPDMPGYGQSERPDWAREPRDLAVLLHRLLDRLDLDGVTLVGLGFGGFVAAEMATLNQRRLSRLVLVGAAGVKPDDGEIADQMLMDHDEYSKAGFSDDDAFEAYFGTEVDDAIDDIWDFSRVMTARLTWSPYMFSRQLPHLLTEVETPTLLVWGRNDRIVPLDCAARYEGALPNARLAVVESAGHNIDLEQPDELARLIVEHAQP